MRICPLRVSNIYTMTREKWRLNCDLWIYLHNTISTLETVESWGYRNKVLNLGAESSNAYDRVIGRYDSYYLIAMVIGNNINSIMYPLVFILGSTYLSINVPTW